MFYWFIVYVAWIVWHLVFRIKVIGRENLISDRGYVIAPNHISAIDPVFVVISRITGARMMILAKEELFNITPILSWAWTHAGIVCVKRGTGDTAAVDGAIAHAKNGGGLLIFPEGTRSKDGQLGKLKSGAFVVAAKAQVDMIPCRVIYKGGKMKIFGRCTVIFGKPIPAEKLALGEPQSGKRLRECKEILRGELEVLFVENSQYQ